MFAAAISPVRPCSSHPVDVGQRTEATILAELVRRGFGVLVPFGVNQRYDLVIDMGSHYVRAQCKTGRLRDGRVLFNTHSVRSNTRGSERRGYLDEVDVFIVYCPDLDRVYVIPVEDVPLSEGSLRVEAPANGQLKGIRWAADYELPA